MTARFNFIAACIVSAGTVWLGGCSGGPEPTFPVDGLVTLDGKPLDGGTVLFEMFGPGKSGRRYTARGSIAADGRYSLSTFAAGDGAPAGRYRVAVFAKQAGRLVEHPVSPAKPPIPLSYSSVETSGLEFEVQPGPNTINIELFTSRPGKR